MSYVPGHLEFQPRQIDGWPTIVTESTKKWAVAKVKAAFARHKEELGRDWIDLETAREALFDRYRVTDIPEELRGASLYDFQYAVAHRALLACQASEVWTLKG